LNKIEKNCENWGENKMNQQNGAKCTQKGGKWDKRVRGGGSDDILNSTWTAKENENDPKEMAALNGFRNERSCVGWKTIILCK
jgi:hypothetical protein